jgi:hypothetical protein
VARGDVPPSREEGGTQEDPGRARIGFRVHAGYAAGVVRFREFNGRWRIRTSDLLPQRQALCQGSLVSDSHIDYSTMPPGGRCWLGWPHMSSAHRRGSSPTPSPFQDIKGKLIPVVLREGCRMGGGHAR